MFTQIAVSELGYVRSEHIYIYIAQTEPTHCIHKQRIVLVMFGNNSIRKQELWCLAARLAQSADPFGLFG